MFSKFKSLVLYTQVLVFNAELIRNFSFDQFSVYPLLKLFLYLFILTLSPTLILAAVEIVSIS